MNPEASLKPRHICLILPSFSSGGQERVMAELANYFCNRGHQVSLLLLTKLEQFYTVCDKVQIIEPDYTLNKTGRIAYSLKTFSFVRKNLIRLNPDCVLSFGGKYNSFVLLASLGLSLNVFVSDRSKPGISYGRLQDFLNPICYRWAKGIIAQTEEARTFLKGTTKHNKIKVIGNPIRSIKSGKDKKPLIISVGRLITSKMHDLLINNFKELESQGWELWIAGEGPNRTKLERQIEEEGLSSKVKLIGNVSNIDSLYKSAQIFVFSSVSEGFPNALGEAMSAGLPVVAYDCSAGPADLIQDGENGYLIPVGEETQFKEKLQNLIDSAELRNQFGKKAQQFIHEHQSIEVIGAKFEKFLLHESIS